MAKRAKANDPVGQVVSDEIEEGSAVYQALLATAQEKYHELKHWVFKQYKLVKVDAKDPGRWFLQCLHCPRI